MLDMFMQKATSSSIHPSLRALFTDFVPARKGFGKLG
jgi:hypothetical protein